METPAGAIYHVARDGQVIGAFSFPTLAAKFKDGSVKPTDHYLIEGTSDWKLVSDLKPQFTAHERQLKAEADRKAAEAKAAKEAAEQKAREAEEEKYRRDFQERKEAAECALAAKQKPWKCHTCSGLFVSDGSAASYPDASGGWSALLLLLGAGLFLGLGQSVFFLFSTIGGIMALFATGYLISFGVERGLQQFNSYRPRCPNCSSPYCSKQPE